MDNQDYAELEEIKQLESKLAGLSLPEGLREKAQQMVERLKRVIKFGGFSKEYEPVAKYIDWIAQIPWGKFSQDNLDIVDVKARMDANHYGLEDTKQRILEHIAVLKLNSEKNIDQSGTGEDMSKNMSTLKGSTANAPILCFIGIQGVGKTSLAKSIAGSLNRQFYRIALGGMSSVTGLRGVPKGNDEAEPGQIIKAIIRSGVMNPLILLDEVDKVSISTGARADVMAVLLEILDPEQNATFVDSYVDYPIDLSNVMFITTANNIGGISAALIDRLEIIRFSSYTDDDKIKIGRDYMLPKVLRSVGLSSDQILIDDSVWTLIVRPLGFDAGIRQLERTIATLARKVAMQVVQGNTEKIVITPQNFRQFIPEDFGIVG